MARAAGGPGMHPSEYTKTGKSRTVAGYKCEDYNGAGKFAMGDYTVVSCVSSTAPGAAEFAKFQKAMISKLKDTQLAIPASTPDGIPLVQDTVAKVYREHAEPASAGARAAEKAVRRSSSDRNQGRI